MSAPLLFLFSKKLENVRSIQGEPLVGAFVGAFVVATGEAVGDTEGKAVGAPVEPTGDLLLGNAEGEDVGAPVEATGDAMGDAEGEDDGAPVEVSGDALGDTVGDIVTTGQIPTQILILAWVPILFTVTVTSSPLNTESDVQLPPALSFASSTDGE